MWLHELDHNRQRTREYNLRLSSSWEANENDSDSSRVKESTRHGAVELGWSHRVCLVIFDIVNAINEGR